eukprot:COSAG02_NODE_3067_length_7431_cov_2.613475_1_plen_122_part_00
MAQDARTRAATPAPRRADSTRSIPGRFRFAFLFRKSSQDGAEMQYWCVFAKILFLSMLRCISENVNYPSEIQSSERDTLFTDAPPGTPVGHVTTRTKTSKPVRHGTAVPDQALIDCPAPVR